MSAMITDSKVNRSDMVWLYVANALVLLASLLAYRLVTQFLGEMGFAQYALTRRTVSFLCPALLLGLGVGLPRFIAMSQNHNDGTHARYFFWLAMIPMVAAHLVIGLAIGLGDSVFARLVFGEESYAGLSVPLIILVFGLSWHTLLKSFYRGTFNFGAASVLDILNLAIIPVAVFRFFSASVADLVLSTGLLNIAVCTGLTVKIGLFREWNFSEAWVAAKKMLAYSLPRVPGDFALGGLLALPSMIAAHIVGMQVAGYVAFGSTLLALGGAAVAPISTAVLPLASYRIHNNQWHLLRSEMLKVVWLTFGLGAAGVALAVALMPWIVRVYLGPEFVDSVSILRILSVSALPYVMFCSLRSFLDAAHISAINSRNILLSLLGFGMALGVLLLVHGRLIMTILISSTIGHFILGVLTVLEICKLMNLSRAAMDGGRGGEDTRSQGGEL
jgi:O-antigen/teichoic acid export membrane protein